MQHSLRLPHYFSSKINKKIDELYVSTAISNFAQQVVMVFEPLFLYSVLGLSVPQVLYFFAAVYGAYILLLPFGGYVASRYGYAHAILFNIPFQILFWFFLFSAQDNIVFLYIAPFIFALQKAVYWPAFHASIARFADHGQLGREFSVLKALINLAAITGPVLGGLISERFGVRMLFVIASSLYTLSFIPLFIEQEKFIPKLYHFRETWKLFKTFPNKFLGYMGFGEELLVLTVWPIFIFMEVGNFAATGRLVTLSTLIATIIVLIIGRLTDSWKKQTLIRVGTAVYFLIWLSRFTLQFGGVGTVLATSFAGIFVIDMLSRTVKDFIFVPLSALTYERAENTHIVPYAVFFEQSLAIGKLLACILGALIFTCLSTVSVTASFLGIFGLAAGFALLYALL